MRVRSPPRVSRVEYRTGHGQLDDDDPGRLLIASPSTVNIWNALPPDAWTPDERLRSFGNAYEALETAPPTLAPTGSG